MRYNLIVMTVGLYIILTAAVISGISVILTCLAAWLASPILFCLLAVVYEKAPRSRGGRGETAWQVLKDVFHLRTRAWSFIIGDIIILPAAFAIATDKWSMSENDNGLAIWWLVVCLLVGISVGMYVYYRIDTTVYTTAGFADSLNAPTKLFHDFVSYPVLTGASICTFVPLIMTPDNRMPWTWEWHVNVHTIGIVGLIAIWFALNVIDGQRGLVPWGHPKFDPLRGGCFI